MTRSVELPRVLQRFPNATSRVAITEAAEIIQVRRARFAADDTLLNGLEKRATSKQVKLPRGELRIQAKLQAQPISSVFGLLKNKKSGTVVSIEEMNQAVATGWSEPAPPTTH